MAPAPRLRRISSGRSHRETRKSDKGPAHRTPAAEPLRYVPAAPHGTAPEFTYDPIENE